MRSFALPVIRIAKLCERAFCANHWQEANYERITILPIHLLLTSEASWTYFLIFHSNSWSFNCLVIKHIVLDSLSCISNDYALVFLQIDSMWSLIEYRNTIASCWSPILHPRQTAIIGANSLSFFMLTIVYPYPVYLPCSVQVSIPGTQFANALKTFTTFVLCLVHSIIYTVRVELTQPPGWPLEIHWRKPNLQSFGDNCLLDNHCHLCKSLLKP